MKAILFTILFILCATISGFAQQDFVADYRNNIPQKSSRMRGKVLSVVGDSEAAGHKNGKADTYCYYIAERNGMKLHNLALNGQKLCNAIEGKDWPALIDYYTCIPQESDYILVHIGYNDTFSPSESDESRDTLSFKGAFNTLILRLQQRYPHAAIGVLCPYYFNGEQTYIDRSHWIKQRCKRLGVKCIDGCAKSGLEWKNPVQADMFLDEVHLTVAGHQHMSLIYEKFLKKLKPKTCRKKRKTKHR